MDVLIISDGKPGHVNQARALCSMMGWQCKEAVVKYPVRISKIGSYIFDWLRIRTLFHLQISQADSGDEFNFFKESSNMGAVITVGSASYYPAKVIGNKLGIPVIALMYPRGFRLDFANIFCPSYDNPPARNHITTLPVTLSNRDIGFYEKMTEDFSKKTQYSLPAVSVIIGGDNKYGRIQPEATRQQLSRIFELTPNYQHWVTTSRRTNREVERILESFDFDYQLIYSKEQYNPIPAFLMLSDYVFVTSDSASMVSECVSTGNAKIEVLKNTPKKKSKFDQFIKELQDAGYVHVFDGSLGQANKKVSLGNTIKTALAHINKVTND